jgi:hypothetical protein
MGQVYTTTAVQTDRNTLKLDEELPLVHHRVRVVVEEMPSAPNRYAEVVAAIREEQAAHGHVPRTREDIDRELDAERDSWDF